MKSVGILMIGKKGSVALQHLRDNASELTDRIAFIVIGTDANVKNDYSEEIRSISENLGIATYQRSDFPEETPPCKWIIAIGWKWMIDDPNEKLIVLHDSLLPKYRGFNPLVTAMIEGDNEIGVTAIQANEEVDAGPILAQKSCEITYPIKIETVIDEVSMLYGEVLEELLSKDIRTMEKIAQDEAKATFSLWRNEEDYHIDWNQDAGCIIRFIDAVGFPYKGASTYYKGEKIRILEAEEVKDLNIVNRVPGKILSINNNQPTVVCRKGMIKIKSSNNENGYSHKFKSLRVRLQ